VRRASPLGVRERLTRVDVPVDDLPASSVDHDHLGREEVGGLLPGTSLTVGVGVAAGSAGETAVVEDERPLIDRAGAGRLIVRRVPGTSGTAAGRDTRNR